MKKPLALIWNWALATATAFWSAAVLCRFRGRKRARPLQWLPRDQRHRANDRSPRLGLLRLFAANSFFLVLFSPSSLHAHEPGKSFLNLIVNSNGISGRWDIPLRDLRTVVPLKIDRDGFASWDELTARYPAITAYAIPRLKISIDGRPAALRLRAGETGVEEFADGVYVELPFTLENSTAAKSIEITYQLFFETNSLHRGYLRLECGEHTQTAIFAPDHPVQRFDLSGAGAGGQFLVFLREGVFHIWTGYDHILFLLALLLPAVLRREPGHREIDTRTITGVETALPLPLPFGRGEGGGGGAPVHGKGKPPKSDVYRSHEPVRARRPPQIARANAEARSAGVLAGEFPHRPGARTRNPSRQAAVRGKGKPPKSDANRSHEPLPANGGRLLPRTFGRGKGFPVHGKGFIGLRSLAQRRNSTAEGRWTIAPNLREALAYVVKIVTAFTVAHSITLSLAACHLVSLPSRLTESAIAASVILAAANNLWPVVRDRGWMVAFGFGLVHGFGFANALSELGLERGALALRLVGFNLGVEAGQLAIVAIFVPVAFALRRTSFYQMFLLKGGSTAVILIATVWLLERVLNFKVLPF